MKKIKNYDEIILEQNTLIILDIDDTIIKFNSMGKTWWEDILHDYEQHHDKQTAYQLAYDDWKAMINKDTPELLDHELFMDLLDRIERTNSKLILLTARESTMKEITLKNLKDCGIHIDPNDVYHSSFKGEIVKDLYETYKANQFIFVDDLLKNIEDVITTMKTYKIDCYLMEHENL